MAEQPVPDGPVDAGLAAWQAAGTDEVMLPTGTEVRIYRPSLEILAREELLTGTLRLAALRERSGSNAPSDDETRAAQDKAHRLVGEHLREFHPPSGAWLPVPPEIAGGDLSMLPPVDREALVALTLHARSPRYVDTRSRLALGLISEKEAGATLSRESGGVASWAGFRAERAGVADGRDGKGVRSGAQRPAGRARSRRGVPARRGADAPPAAGTAQA